LPRESLAVRVPTDAHLSPCEPGVHRDALDDLAVGGFPEKEIRDAAVVAAAGGGDAAGEPDGGGRGAIGRQGAELASVGGGIELRRKRQDRFGSREGEDSGDVRS